MTLGIARLSATAVAMTRAAATAAAQSTVATTMPVGFTAGYAAGAAHSWQMQYRLSPSLLSLLDGRQTAVLHQGEPFGTYPVSDSLWKPRVNER